MTGYPQFRTQQNALPVAKWVELSHSIKPFVDAARASNTLGAFAFVEQMPRTDIHRMPSLEFSAQLKRRVSRAAAAAKTMELPAAPPNPARVCRWLAMSAPHISIVFSPLTERGPPRL